MGPEVLLFSRADEFDIPQSMRIRAFASIDFDSKHPFAKSIARWEHLFELS
jgi:hypothetical protein